jgi:RNA polymerase sigma-70 factor (ECF subfamily)
LFKTARFNCLRILRERGHCDRAVGGSSVLQKLYDVAAQDNQGKAEELDCQRWAFCWVAGEIEREVEPTTWRAFWLTAVEGIAPALAAEKLQMNIGAIYAAKCRVLDRLRKCADRLCRSES